LPPFEGPPLGQYHVCQYPLATTLYEVQGHYRSPDHKNPVRFPAGRGHFSEARA
jgi:hypothetical protein